MEDDSHSTTPGADLRLVAQAECWDASRGPANTHTNKNYFRSSQWSPDGTCLITNSADNCIRTFIVPPNLLDQHEQPLQLKAYSTIESHEPADALTCYPGYCLEDSSTTFVLSATNEHPIRLNSTLTGSLVASYPLVSPTTEAYLKPRSMIFTSDGNHFVAGSHSLLSTFDVSRTGSGPISSIKTGPKSAKTSWSNPNLSLRGHISALALDTQFNVLVAGTLSRSVGLYDSAGQGECVGTFSISGTDADKVVSGNGISQLAWSKCGRYLYIVERKSDGAMIYDIRKTGQLLSWIVGRNAVTNQRMEANLTARVDNGVQDLWAGGQDGCVRRWNEPHLYEGPIQCGETLHVHHDLVNSVSMHRTADVLMTAAGQRSIDDPAEDINSSLLSLLKMDRSLKIWHRADLQRQFDS